jgi:hypothetical protein
MIKSIKNNQMDEAYSTRGEEDKCIVLVGNPEGNCHLVELGVDERIIAEFILSKQDGRVWIGFT